MTNQLAHGERPASRQPVAFFPLRWTLCLLIQVYRRLISPAQTFLFGAQAGCRFTPTCSQYAMEAIKEHGAVTGISLAFKRICRCNPFGECGHDPVPRAPLTVPMERGPR